MRARRQIGTSLLLAPVLLGLVGASSASAASRSKGEGLSPREASKALHRATRLLDGGKDRRRLRRTRPKEITTTLLALSRSLPNLRPAQRRRAKALLARPTDSPDADGNPYTAPEQPPLCTAHFCVHYVATTPDAPDPADGNGNGVPDYVEQVASVAETVYGVENGALGWQAPRPDGARGGDPRVDIYLAQLRGEVFGYAAPDIGQAGRSQYAYLVVDDDYATAEFPGTVPLIDLQVTLAHEYNHVLQFGYDIAQDLWFYEATAVWIEDRVYPQLDDYLRYIKRWVVRSKLPITINNIKIYGTAVFNHWLAGRHGHAVIRTAWERAPAVKPAGFSIDAYNAAIRAAARSAGKRVRRRDLAHEFARFAATSAEWRTPGAFPYADAPLWNDVKRRGKLRPRRFITRKLSHTGYLLLRVRPRKVRAMRLIAGARRGTKAAFALVCRRGPVATGKVRIKMRFTKRGGVRGVTLRRPGRCDRITAVLVNADARQVGFAFGDWLYSDDHRRFAATLLLRR
ncbi:MAG: MXAN_6640 family putative metalloprotease [Solirubrobacterales bacterium]